METNTTPLKDKGQPGVHAFPAKLLTLSLSLTLFVVIWMGGNSFFIHYFLTHSIARDQQVARISNEILYLDSVITMSSRVSATGDAEFDKHYMEAIQQELREKIAALPEKDLRDVIYAAEQANDTIIALDKQYTDMIEKSDLEGAEKVIHGADYANANKTHLAGRRQLTDKIDKASQKNLLDLETNIYVALLLVVLVAIVLFITWYYAIQSVRRWREELEVSRAREIRAKEDAEAANAALIISEQVAKKSAQEAEKANLAKSEFLTNMSHELRTPLHAILGFSRQAQGQPGVSENKMLQTMLGNIRMSGNRLMGLLNNLLDLSKLEAGKGSFDFKNEDLLRAIDHTLMEIAPLAQAKNIRIDVQRLDTSTVVWYDYKTMVQVFVNLISNAIKFSPHDSEIMISLSEMKTSPLQTALLCRVQDNGVGIPDNELEVIFDKFIQSSKTKSGAGGTGLGLAIVRQIIEAHQGKIWAENTAGGGACFNLILPYNMTTLTAGATI